MSDHRSREEQGETEDPSNKAVARTGSLGLTANVPDGQMYSWESQAVQYPPKGPPGISYFRGQLDQQLYVDCLLYRDEAGDLVGILNHFPTDFPPHERAGDQSVWVHPGRRRQGIGSALITEAFFRWGPVPGAGDGELKLTASGVQMLQGMEDKRSIVEHVLPAPPEVVFDWWVDAERLPDWIVIGPRRPTRVEIDPQAGGIIRIDLHDQASSSSIKGRYLIVERPGGFACTWHSSTWPPSTPESVLMVQLEADGGDRTRMTIRHGRLPEEFRKPYEESWSHTAERLHERLLAR